jgi:hypothetical protein
MEGELDLLLSVAGGLGKWHDINDNRRVYVKDDDCLGAGSLFHTIPHDT